MKHLVPLLLALALLPVCSGSRGSCDSDPDLYCASGYRHFSQPD